MKTNRQTKIQEFLLAAADDYRPAKARIKDILKLIRWQKTGLGLPTKRKVGRLLRGIRSAALLRQERDVVEFVDRTFKAMNHYFQKREGVLIEVRNKRFTEKQLKADPGMPPGPPYPGYEWRYAIKDCRVIWRMVEETL